MATRKETQAQRQAVEQALRMALREGRTTPGAVLPPVREIAETYGVSSYTAHQALKTLAAEGLFHAVPKVGTFAGKTSARRRGGEARETYVLLVRDGALTERDRLLKMGFEDAIAHAGGAALTWTKSQTREVESSGRWPDIAGLFEWEMWVPYEIGDAARVCFYTDAPPVAFLRDNVAFDDEAGGQMATEYLLGEGYTEIAFLGLHDREGNGLIWSCEREEGWRRVLQENGLLARAFHPEHAPALYDFDDWRRAAREAALAFLRDPALSRVSAVVAANDIVALHLLEELRHADVPRSSWPAVVGFDNDPRGAHLLSSLRLPWEEIGRAAAELLWQRRRQPQSVAVQRRIAMKLIPRLSCRTRWASTAALLDPALRAAPPSQPVPS